MTKITFSLMLLLLIGSSSLASSETKFTKVTVLDKGIKRIIRISIDTNQTSNMLTYSAAQIESKEGIIIKFKNDSTTSISEFETKYGLKLKHKLITGYYIFRNVSDSSDIEILSSIINSDNNIETVKPNWKMKNTPR